MINKILAASADGFERGVLVTVEVASILAGVATVAWVVACCWVVVGWFR